MPINKAMATPPSDKENSLTLANAALPAATVKGPTEKNPDDKKADTKSGPEADEFDDADALEALVEAEITQARATKA